MIGRVPEPQCVVDNSAFEAATPASPPVAADLQAARLRLEAAESERAALAAELASMQARLHDSLEVLQGVLGERSALVEQNRELQAQLAVALAEQRGARSPASEAEGGQSADCTPTPPGAGNTPQRQLRQELVLAQAQLRELQQAQRVWEAERQALLQEAEEERLRLQEGLSEALQEATSAQREADSAAERAAHWCSLASLLQRSALLPDAPASPPSGGLSLSSTPASSRARSAVAASLPPSAAGSCSKSANGTAVARLLAELGSAPRQPRRPAATGRGVGGPLLAASANSEGPGLIAAFQAVAADSPPQGSPVQAAGKGSAGSSQPAASADLSLDTAPLLTQRPAKPGLSDASSMGPITPAAAAAGPGTTGSATPMSVTGARQAPPKRSFLQRLLAKGVCGAGGLQAGGAASPAHSRRWVD